MKISPAKSNNSQQDIAIDLYLLQIENQELTTATKDFYQRTNELLNSMEILKSENPTLRQELALKPQLQQINGRILQTEQIVLEIKNFGIRQTEQPQMLNDPMKIEQQPLTSENPHRKYLFPIGEQGSVSTHKRTQSKNFFHFQQKQKKEIENIMVKYWQSIGKIFLGFNILGTSLLSQCIFFYVFYLLDCIARIK